MSYWVRAHIKFEVRGTMSVDDIETAFGFMDSWEHGYAFRREDEPNKYRSKREPEIIFLPEGSEGTLDIIVWKTTKKKTVFSVCGGLRDRSDCDFIKKWFDTVIERNKSRIISAIGWASPDCGDDMSFRYSEPLDSKIENAKWDIQKFFRDIHYAVWEFYNVHFKRSGDDDVDG